MCLLCLFSSPASLSAHHSPQQNCCTSGANSRLMFSRGQGNLWPVSSCTRQNQMIHEIRVSIQLTLQQAVLLNLFQYIDLISFPTTPPPPPPILRGFLINTYQCHKGYSEVPAKAASRWCFLHVKRLSRLQSQVFRHKERRIKVIHSQPILLFNLNPSSRNFLPVFAICFSV